MKWGLKQYVIFFLDFSTLLLPLVHGQQGLRADGRWVLRISPDDFMDPGQICGDLHVDRILVLPAGFIKGEDPRRVDISCFGVPDSQSAARVAGANVFLIAGGGAGAEHAVVHRRRETASLVFGFAVRVVDQGEYEVFEGPGEGQVGPPAPAGDRPRPLAQVLASLGQRDGGDFGVHRHGLLQLNQSQVVVPVGLILEARMENNLEGTEVAESAAAFFKIPVVFIFFCSPSPQPPPWSAWLHPAQWFPGKP